jgi:hypothetical protein
MEMLQCGNSERLKTGVHAAVFGLAAVCGLYNAAAWVSRRQTHLAINAVLYAALMVWEQQHVAHHLAELRQPDTSAVPGPVAGSEIADPAAVAA